MLFYKRNINISIPTADPDISVKIMHLLFMGVRRGAVPPPLDFHTWYIVVNKGLIVLFFGLFCYFLVFFSITPLPPGNFSADALATITKH